MSDFALIENYKLVAAINPKTTSAAVSGDYICMKNAHEVWVVLNFTNAVAAATAVTILESTAVGTTGATSTKSFKWWENNNIASTDTLVRQTDGASATIANTTNNQQVVCLVDPGKFSATYDCMAVRVAASTQATNFVTANYYIRTRYAEDVPPAAITS